MVGIGQLRRNFFIEFPLNCLGVNGLADVGYIYQSSLLLKDSRHGFMLFLSTFLILLSQVSNEISIY